MLIKLVALSSYASGFLQLILFLNQDKLFALQ